MLTTPRFVWLTFISHIVCFLSDGYRHTAANNAHVLTLSLKAYWFEVFDVLSNVTVRNSAPKALTALFGVLFKSFNLSVPHKNLIAFFYSVGQEAGLKKMEIFSSFFPYGLG